MKLNGTIRQGQLWSERPLQLDYSDILLLQSFNLTDPHDSLAAKYLPNQTGATDWKKLLPVSHHLWPSWLLDHWLKLTRVGFPDITSLNRTFHFEIFFLANHYLCENCNEAHTHWGEMNYAGRLKLTGLYFRAFYTIYWHLMLTHSNSNKVRYDRSKYLHKIALTVHTPGYKHFQRVSHTFWHTYSICRNCCYNYRQPTQNLSDLISRFLTYFYSIKTR